VANDNKVMYTWLTVDVLKKGLRNAWKAILLIIK
jgi:hypothetical protein